MIENNNTVNKDLEKALQALEQAKQRVVNEKKKQNEKIRKAENHHKYIMGGNYVVIIVIRCQKWESGASGIYFSEKADDRFNRFKKFFKERLILWQ